MLAKQSAGFLFCKSAAVQEMDTSCISADVPSAGIYRLNTAINLRVKRRGANIVPRKEFLKNEKNTDNTEHDCIKYGLA